MRVVVSASRDSELTCCGVYGLREQGGDGHRSDSAGDGSDQAGAGAGGVEIHVADVARVVPGIDHHRARFDVLTADQPWPPHGRHHDVCFPGKGLSNERCNWGC
jgi:hypothetical protein